MCASRMQGKGCQQKSALLEVYEAQIEGYLENFHIPDDYQEKYWMFIKNWRTPTTMSRKRDLDFSQGSTVTRNSSVEGIFQKVSI